MDVPTPIALPFAYFPLTTGRVAGILFPTFGNDPRRGYFIQNGGYYLPISDYVDLSITGDYYTNGSYGLQGRSIYSKRYKFNGNVNISYENLVTSQRGFDDLFQIPVLRLFFLPFSALERTEAKQGKNEPLGSALAHEERWLHHQQQTLDGALLRAPLDTNENKKCPPARPRTPPALQLVQDQDLGLEQQL